MPDVHNNDLVNNAHLNASRASRNMLFGFLGIVFVVLVIFCVSYMVYYQKSRLTTQETTIEQTAGRLARERENNQRQFVEFKQTISEQQEKLDALTQRLEAVQAVMNTGANGNINNDNWRLAEALYLSRLAVERVQTLKDVQTAIFQLEAADERLASIHSPQLMPVRKVLIDTLGALKAVETPDREGLWLRLGVLSAQIDNLKLRFLEKPSIDSTSSSLTVSGWRGALNTISTKLKSLVQIRSPQENASLHGIINKITTEAEGKRLKQAFVLLIEEARAALVHKEGWVYSASLSTAEQWLIQYFAQDKTQEYFLSEIAALKEQKIDPDLPDISVVVEIINKAIAERSRRE